METIIKLYTSLPTFFSDVYYHNKVWHWLLAIALISFVFLFLTYVKNRVTKAIRDKVGYDSTGFLDTIADTLEDTYRFFLLIAGIYGAIVITRLQGPIAHYGRNVFLVGLVLQASIWASGFFKIFLVKVLLGGYRDPSKLPTLSIVGTLGQFAIWIVAGLLILDNFGVDITALVAGLGIGGIAVALAVQKLLEDLLSSVAIVLDKPFEIGDFIIVGDLMGTVERIGIKTTRLRSLSGEQLIFPNTDLLGSRIRNFKRMYERRVVFTLGVTYQTSLTKLKEIPGILREIVEKAEGARFDRAHFVRYGPSSLDFEVVYYVLSSDYLIYADIQQAINLAIFERFTEAGIDFAYPTQKLLIEKNEPHAVGSS